MFTNRFGAYWLSGGFRAEALTTTPRRFTTWNHHQSGPGVEATGSGRLVVKKPGYYLAQAELSFNGTAGVIYYFQLRENGTANDFINSIEGITSNGRIHISTLAGGHPDANDYIELYVWASVNANITPISGQFYVMNS